MGIKRSCLMALAKYFHQIPFLSNVVFAIWLPKGNIFNFQLEQKFQLRPFPNIWNFLKLSCRPLTTLQNLSFEISSVKLSTSSPLEPLCWTSGIMCSRRLQALIFRRWFTLIWSCGAIDFSTLWWFQISNWI